MNAIENKVAAVRAARLAENDAGRVACPDCGKAGGHGVEDTEFLCVGCDRFFPVVRDRDVQAPDRYRMNPHFKTGRLPRRRF